ncbi:PKD domain-containing protein [Winogradskyella sp. A3E31]|uniref:PKD domain-containing protein n=1 Tax=Winogradskyella sp. A3E31 TaxID=3349637 RepID=UPI00398AA7FB
MPKIKIFSFLFLLVSAICFSQVNSPGGVTCDEAGPICSDNTGNFVFENNNDSSTNINTDIACLGTPPRPSWFFLRVGQTGNLEFEIVQTSNGGGGIDVDFVVWGPFASPDGNCNNINTNCPTCPDNVQNPNYYPNDLDNSNIVDCSWSPASIESMTLPNAIAGEYYLLLVSNWGGGEGVIEINQTNFGTPAGGSTDCSIINVDGILGPDQRVCGPQSITLDANPNNEPDFIGYDWEYDDGTGFVSIPGTVGMSSITVSDEGVYRVTVTDINSDSDTDVMEFIIDDIPTANPVNNQIICDDNNDGFWAFDFLALESIILGGQPASDFDITFHANLNDAEMNMAPLSNPYTNQTAYQEETIFVRIENVANTDCYSTGSFLIDVFISLQRIP